MPTLDLGAGVIARPSLGFVHVDEGATETCLTPGDCFQISPALKLDFLPHRETTLVDYLTATFCTGCAPGAIDDSLDVAAGSDGPVVPPVRVPSVEDDAAIEALLEYERLLEGTQPRTIGGAPASRMH
jgi:hypothetical protein